MLKLSNSKNVIFASAALIAAFASTSCTAQEETQPAETETSTEQTLPAEETKDGEKALIIEELDNGCFIIQRDPTKEGGLRVPQQKVCPTVDPDEDTSSLFSKPSADPE